jgi:putative oxidoreductase
MSEGFYASATRVTYAILRITTGIFFMMHGGQKLLGWFGGMDGQGATAQLMTQIGLAGVLELVGGTLIVLGLMTRPVAFVLAGEMAFAYFIAHFPRGFWPIQNGGEPAVLYCFIFLYMAARGAGAFSVDAMIGRRWGIPTAVDAGGEREASKRGRHAA